MLVLGICGSPRKEKKSGVYKTRVTEKMQAIMMEKFEGSA
jgi:hypothetical protein